MNKPSQEVIKIKKKKKKPSGQWLGSSQHSDANVFALKNAWACKSHLAPDVFVDQVVLALVVKDHMNLLSPWPTDVRS